MSQVYLLKKSNRRGKRFIIDMGDHSHHFGSDVGKTYIDHQDDKKKENWIARHRKDKNWDNIHSGIYNSDIYYGQNLLSKKQLRIMKKKTMLE
jgi:hypothetical protein